MMVRAHSRLRFRASCAIALFGLSLLLIGLGSTRVLTYHEMVFAQPAREMLATGEWAVARIAGQVFPDKPPGMSWAIAAVMALTGSESEWAARLPAALAAVLTALVIAMLAGRWFDSRVGVVAGLMQLTTVSTLMQGRLAEADMPLCLLVTVAMTAFAFGVVEHSFVALVRDALPEARRKRTRLNAAVFYLVLGLAFLFKATIGPVFALAGCGAWTLLNRDRRALRFLLDPVGLAIGAACVAPWLVSVWRNHPEMFDFLVRHNLGRFQGHFPRHEPWYAYFYLVPLMLLPWTPLVALGLWQGRRAGWWHDARWRFLACWCVPGMVILCWSAFKSKHYPIPLLPPLVILAAAAWCDLAARRFRADEVRHGWAKLATVVGAAVAIAAVWQFDRRHPPQTTVVVGIIAVGLLTILVSEERRWRRAAFAATFGTAWAAAVAVQLLVMPRHDSYRAQTELAARVNAAVPADETVYLVHLPDNQITYYLRRPLVRHDVEACFPDWPALGSHGVYVLAPAHTAAWLSLRGDVEILDRSAYLHRYFTEADRLTFLRWSPAVRTARLP